MSIQGVRATVPQAAGVLRKFRSNINSQVQRQVRNVRAEVKRLVNFKA